MRKIVAGLSTLAFCLAVSGCGETKVEVKSPGNPVVVEKPVVIEKPVVVEKPVIVEKPVVVGHPVVVVKPVVIEKR